MIDHAYLRITYYLHIYITHSLCQIIIIVDSIIFLEDLKIYGEKKRERFEKKIKFEKDLKEI